MPEHHLILGDKVHIYKRSNSTLWQCSTYFAGKNRRTSTKEESLAKAKEIAEDWYLRLRGKLRDGDWVEIVIDRLGNGGGRRHRIFEEIPASMRRPGGFDFLLQARGMRL